MARPDRSTNRRTQLITAAVTCFHQKGYSRVALADIAAEAGVPVGNVYYYFKTKSALAHAAVDSWLARFVTIDALLRELPDPKTRLLAFLDRADDWSEVYTQFGCPLANLSRDLINEGEPGLASRTGELYAGMYRWAGEQFSGLGQQPDEAVTNARILVAGLQGGILMAHANQDRSLLTSQIDHLKAWVAAMESHT